MSRLEVPMVRCYSCKYRSECAAEWNDPSKRESYCAQDFEFKSGRWVLREAAQIGEGKTE